MQSGVALRAPAGAAVPSPATPEPAGVGLATPSGGAAEGKAGAPPATPPVPGLTATLLESRQRWRDIATLAADFAFETDLAGRFTFLWPDRLLDHETGALLGMPAAALLPPGTVNPFVAEVVLRGRRCWVRRAGGGLACLAVSAAPLLSPEGERRGTRGAARDCTAEEAALSEAAAATRRAALAQSVAGAGEAREGTAQAALGGTLARLVQGLGCEGARVLRPGAPGPAARHGPLPPPLPDAMAALETGADWNGLGPGLHPAALVQHRAADGRPAFLLAWRAAGQRPFDADDLHVLRVLGELLARLLAYAERHQEAARLARTEPLTGLLNRRGFLEELRRRLARLDRRAEPGALLFADVDNLKPLNDRHGHEAGDAALVAVAAALRAATRAGDLLGRIGGDEFVAWLDSTDAAAAEARAAAISRALAAAMERRLPAGAPGATLSIGVALRPGGSGETAEALLAHADAALYAAKREGRGVWRVAEPAP